MLCFFWISFKKKKQNGQFCKREINNDRKQPQNPSSEATSQFKERGERRDRPDPVEWRRTTNRNAESKVSNRFLKSRLQTSGFPVRRSPLDHAHKPQLRHHTQAPPPFQPLPAWPAPPSHAVTHWYTSAPAPTGPGREGEGEKKKKL